MRRLAAHIFTTTAASLAVTFIALSVPAVAHAQSPFQCKTPATVQRTGPVDFDPKKGSISGHVLIICDGTSIYADKIEWDEKTVVATGDVLVIQEGLRVNALRMEMDRITKMGTFFNAVGTARLTGAPEPSMFGTMEPEVMFQAEKLERIGPRSYRITNGRFSTCQQPNPRWQMTGSSGTIVMDDHAIMKNVALRVKGVPVMYLPYMYLPLEKEDRATGFLIPQYTASGVQGWGLSNAFFWVLGRSHDATFYYDWRSKGYQGAAAEYRYKASSNSFGDAYYAMSDEDDRLTPDGTVERAGRRSFEVKGKINQALPRGFRLTGYSNYRSDITTQQLYQQDIFEQSRRDRNLVLAVDGNLLSNTLRINAATEQRDYFNGATIARKSTLPKLEMWLTRSSLGSTIRRLKGEGSASAGSGPLEKIYFGAAGQTAYLDVRPNLDQPLFDRSLWRFDGTTDVSAPLSNFDWLTVNGRASWRVTSWQESLDPLTGVPVPIPLTRNLFNLHADVVGPVLERTFVTPNNGYAEKFQHRIEPRVYVDYLSPFNERNRVIQIDPHIDQLVGGTTSISYAFINRFYAKIRNGNDRAEILNVTLSQTWYSNAQAGAIDPNYPSPTINTYSPIRFTVASAPVDDVMGKFEVYIDSLTKNIQSYSASAYLRPNNGERFEVEAGWSRRPFRLLDPNFNNPNNASHFLNAGATARFLQGRIEGTYSFNYDLKSSGFLQQRIRGYYGSQCCGLAIEYQMMNVSQFALSGVQRDRRLAVTFNLAGLGSFAAPLGGFGR